MFEIDLKSRKAIYQQIIDQFKRLIVLGVLKEDDKVPSIRELSKTLIVNPNTIQKAYRVLEQQGYFYTVLGQGSFIGSPPKEDGAQVRSLYTSLEKMIQEMKYYGIPKGDIITFIEKIWMEDCLDD